MSAVAHIEQYKTGRFFSDTFRNAMSWNGYERNTLLRNESCGNSGGVLFTQVASALGADHEGDARGVAVADFDNDGDLDLAINNNPGASGQRSRAAAALLRNDVGTRRNWLAIELEGTESNRDAVGATVRIEAGGLRPMRMVSAGSGYASQHSHRQHVGLGDAQLVERLSVRWPSGRLDHFENLPVNVLLKLVEGQDPEWMKLPHLGDAG